MKYTFIHQSRAEHPVATLCRVIGVSPSGYYDWRAAQKTSLCDRRLRRQQIDRHVREMFERKRERYGAPRVTLALRREGHHYNRKTVAASMARQGLRARAARRFKATTHSRHNLPVSPNLLEQDFTATAPNQKYVQDITYLWSDEGWSYLAVVIDLYSRSVVGWSLDKRMTADLACAALRMAMIRRRNPTGVIVHSDRGSQYCSSTFQSLIEQHDLVGSMSKVGCCYDNACAESFFHSLKVEAIHGEAIKTRVALQRMIFEYIEIDYNVDRLHSSLGYVSPAEYEAERVT